MIDVAKYLITYTYLYFQQNLTKLTLTKIAIRLKMFSLENLFDEKGTYPYLHHEMFGRHMSNIYPC